MPIRLEIATRQIFTKEGKMCGFALDKPG